MIGCYAADNQSRDAFTVQPRLEIRADERTVHRLDQEGFACAFACLGLDVVAGLAQREQLSFAGASMPDMKDWTPSRSPRAQETPNIQFGIRVVALPPTVDYQMLSVRQLQGAQSGRRWPLDYSWLQHVGSPSEGAVFNKT